MKTTVLALVLASGLAPSDAPPSHTASSPAQSDADRAAVLFEAGDFEGAAQAFEAAFRTTGDTMFLYAAGISWQSAGDCAAAVEVLERFRGTGPDPRDDEAAAEVIAACRARTPEPPSPREAVPPEPTTAPPEPRPPRLDGWSKGLLAGGGSVAVLGAALYGASFAVLRPRRRMESEFERDASRSRSLAIAGVSAMAVGTAVLVGGVTRLLVLRRRARVSRTPAQSR